MKIRFRKINQLGFLSLHAILPVAAAVLVIGGVGSYVLQKSKAFSDSGVVGGAVLPNYAAKCTISGVASSINGGTTIYPTVTVTNTGRSSFVPNIAISVGFGDAEGHGSGSSPSYTLAKIASTKSTSKKITLKIPPKSVAQTQGGVSVTSNTNKPSFTCKKDFTIL